MKDSSIKTALVFTRTKHGADKVAKLLNRENIYSDAIHGEKSQNSRQRALSMFKKGEIRVLVATDIAARGIDINELSHVVNYDVPNVPESYVHRIGRTGRAGADGIAWSFCDGEERAYLKDIIKVIGQTIPIAEDHPYQSKGGRAVNHNTQTANRFSFRSDNRRVERTTERTWNNRMPEKLKAAL